MRLIDAEQTKLMLSELLEVAKKENFTAEDVIDHACVWVDNQPTAYDVDAVVAELKKESYQEWCDSPKIVELKDAIEIVRNAGKDGAE